MRIERSGMTRSGDIWRTSIVASLYPKSEQRRNRNFGCLSGACDSCVILRQVNFLELLKSSVQGTLWMESVGFRSHFENRMEELRSRGCLEYKPEKQEGKKTLWNTVSH
jgi:hypothetical protein